MVELLIPNQRVAGSIPVRVKSFFNFEIFTASSRIFFWSYSFHILMLEELPGVSGMRTEVARLMLLDVGFRAR